MTRLQLPEIDYPESDGDPMGETQLHIVWSIRLLQMLEHRYADEHALVGANLIFYYLEGDPERYVVPDVFVVKDCSPTPLRRTFKIWEEKRVPNCVIEVTSRKTRHRDRRVKPGIYAGMGIPEYFLFDPTSDYLNPPLQGHRLDADRYVRIEPDADGRLACDELGLLLCLDGRNLELLDADTGERLPTPLEAERAAREAERAAREAAEAELARLKQRLADERRGQSTE